MGALMEGKEEGGKSCPHKSSRDSWLYLSKHCFESHVANLHCKDLSSSAKCKTLKGKIFCITD